MSLLVQNLDSLGVMADGFRLLPFCQLFVITPSHRVSDWTHNRLLRVLSLTPNCSLISLHIQTLTSWPLTKRLNLSQCETSCSLNNFIVYYSPKNRLSYHLQGHLYLWTLLSEFHTQTLISSSRPIAIMLQHFVQTRTCSCRYSNHNLRQIAYTHTYIYYY